MGDALLFVDLGGVTAPGIALDRRPGLLAAIENVRASGSKFLVAEKRDRDVILTAQLERLTARHGAQLIATDGVGEGESREAELMRRMVNAFASYERALIRCRTRAATPPRQQDPTLSMATWVDHDLRTAATRPPSVQSNSNGTS